MSNIIAIEMILLSYILIVDYNAQIFDKKQLKNNITTCILLKCIINNNIINLYRLLF